MINPITLFRSGLAMLLLAGGCASYAVPGSGANLRDLGMTASARNRQTDPDVSVALDKKPLASFPATVAIVRVQGANYNERTAQMYGQGNYRVVLTHDVEKPDAFDRLAKLPNVAGLEPINRLELPEQLTSDRELRAAAASLHADMVLIYTFDDKFDDRDLASAMTLLTLGISPNKFLTVTSTVSAVLMDTRNGYIYGAAEMSDRQSTLANCWGENAAADAVREQVEGAAFEKLVPQLEKTWTQVAAQYAPVKGKVQ
jgi:hypothetical protein